jgi:hypothetical protein
MRWSGINRSGLVLILMLVLSSAAALAFTSDADILVTDGRGVIVGVGRMTMGVSFELRLLGGFSGPARLTMLHVDGRTETLDIVVGDGISHGELNLLELIRDRFDVVTIELGGAPWPPFGGGAGGAAADDGSQSEAPSMRETSPSDRVPGEVPPVHPPTPRSPGRP